MKKPHTTTLKRMTVARLRVGCAVVAGLLLLTGDPRAAGPAPSQKRLPAALESYLATAVHLSSSEKQSLVSGAPVTKLLEGVDASKEVAVFGAVWINAAPSSYVARVQDIEHFERGGAFKITKRISDPPTLGDFAQLDLPKDDLEDLRSCRAGDCELKLSAASLRKLQTEVDWDKPTANAEAVDLFRRLAYEYVAGYRQGGNARLAIYRDADRPTFVANEFRSMIERLPALSLLPDLRRYLLDYPNAPLPQSRDFLYWQIVQFGLKPTIRINHVVIQERADSTVIASKMLYASHYFWTALETRTLMPDASQGPGFWFVTVSRSRSDGLSGFRGRLIRGRIRNEAKNGTLSALTATKTQLETTAR